MSTPITYDCLISFSNMKSKLVILNYERKVYLCKKIKILSEYESLNKKNLDIIKGLRK